MTTKLDAPSRFAGRPVRALLLALLCSICINVALASYLAVQALRPPFQASTRLEREEGNAEAMVRRFANHLPSADAELLWQVYRNKETQILDATAAAHSARARTFSLLAQPNLDKAALQAAFREAMDNRMLAGQLLTDTILEALQRISPQARLQLTKEFRR